MPTLTVITLTRNRFHRLADCLQRVLGQLEPGDEMLVIDTGSTDATRAHYAHWQHPRFRFLAHDDGGSWAEIRNRGVREARGDLIAFLDDDCMAAPDWVARGKADLTTADAVGGIARPWGIRRLPGWWHPDMAWMVGLSVPGMVGPDAGRLHYPMTANLWVHAAVAREFPFQEIGGRLGGKVAEHYVAGREDAQWWATLRRAGCRTRIDPQLWVGHAIDPARLALPYLRERARLDGAAWAEREGTPDDLDHLAYAWWDHHLRAFAAPFREPDNLPAAWHYHQLMRRRHAAALVALTSRLGRRPRLIARAAVLARLARTGPRYLADRGRTAVHALIRPWIVSRPRRPRALVIERVAVIALGYLGDLVLLHCVLRGIMRENPRLGVYVLAPPAARTALGELPRLNLTLLPSLPPESREARDWLLRWLERIDPDAIVAPYLHGPWGVALASIRHPPRPIFAFDRDQGLRRRLHLERLGVRVHKHLELHEIDNLAHLMRVAGLAGDPSPALIRPPADAAERVARHPLMARPGPLVMLNPAAAHAQKEWTEERWAALLARLLAETDARVVINAFAPLRDLERAAEQAGERTLLLRAAPLPELVAWLERCHGLVTVDGGPQHLAHALDIPSITLYGPMDERRWADYWERPIHRTIRACTFDLTPDERRGLPENHMVALIPLEDVWRPLKELLDRWPREERRPVLTPPPASP